MKYADDTAFSERRREVHFTETQGKALSPAGGTTVLLHAIDWSATKKYSASKILDANRPCAMRLGLICPADVRFESVRRRFSWGQK